MTRRGLVYNYGMDVFDVSNKFELQKLFLQGSTPKNLTGFYKGKLNLVISENLLETLGGFLAKIYLPWRGKRFDKDKGINVFPSFFGKNTNFPFKTEVKKGLHDNM